MSLFSLRRFIADIDAPAASGQLDSRTLSSKKPSLQLISTHAIPASVSAVGAQHAAAVDTPLIQPCRSHAAARHAAFELARRWGRSKRRDGGILLVGDQGAYLQANDLAGLHAAVDANTAAIVLDGACASLSAEYCQATAQLCSALHILLIIDDSACCQPLVKERAWAIKADIVIVDHDHAQGFLQPALLVRTHTDGVRAVADLHDRSLASWPPVGAWG